MRLSKSSEYAIRCLVYMSTAEADLCPVQRLADRLNIPYKYLGRLMGHLREAGLVESVRGKNGGYRIARALDEIHLEQIVEAVEGLENFNRCLLGFDLCDEENPCPMHEFWTIPKEHIQDMLTDVTLADMVKSSGKKLA